MASVAANGPNGSELVLAEPARQTAAVVRRDEHGRFIPGTRGGPGNPHVRAIAAWRATLAATVTPEDIAAALQKLVDAARSGERWAIKELLDRCLGTPPRFEQTEDSGSVLKVMEALFHDRMPRMR